MGKAEFTTSSDLETVVQATQWLYRARQLATNGQSERQEFNRILGKPRMKP